MANPLTSQSPAINPEVPKALRPSVSGPSVSGRARRLAALRTIGALILREMSTRYGRTPGGYIWSVLEPLAAILFLSLGFSLLIRAPALGTSFLLFYSTGYLPFSIYQTISSLIAHALKFSKPLLKYPAVTWIDAILARFILNSLTSLLITILLLSGILAVVDNRAVLDIVPIVQALGLAILLGLGVGTMNCVLMGLFPLWTVAWSVVTRPLFIASGVLFLFEDLPMLARDLLWYNPLIHIVGLMRTGFYPTYTASYVNMVYVLLISMVLLTMGLILMRRFHRVILTR